MKLRISNQSLRLRINQDDLYKLTTAGSLQEYLGNDILGTFHYTINVYEGSAIDIELTANEVKVMIPKSYVTEWNDTDRVSFEEHIKGIRVLLEKDFQCLTERPNENESRNFKNPRLTHE